MPGTIIQMGTAKNKGRSKNKRIREKSCITPVSLRFLFEVAKLIKEKIRRPLKPQYKKTLASLKDSTKNPYPERINIKQLANAKTLKKSGKSLSIIKNLYFEFIILI